LTDWIISGPVPQPADIQRQLLLHSLTKTKTLVVTVLGSLLMASITAAVTGARWAMIWAVAELICGTIRLLVMSAFTQAETAGRRGNALAPIAACIASFSVLSMGCYLCVATGEWALILMSGIGLANLIGGIASRNAGTPRYGILLICLLTVPFAVATINSPIPLLYVIGLQTPVYAIGLCFVLLENYRVLLDLYHSERENRRMAHYDLLTGLPNRAMNLKLFDELLSGARSGRAGSDLTVLCLDLDGFKEVNDRFGHATGDAILVAVAQRLRESVREADHICRIGGDEFVIMLPGISAAETAVVAGRIIDSISAPFQVGTPEPLRIGVSIGSASLPQDGSTADQLLRSADRALYAAKRRGKGIFVEYDTFGPDQIEVVPAADADARLAVALQDLAAETGQARLKRVPTARSS
jgi:diguanylate cyclase (GGDEF)-like protein